MKAIAVLSLLLILGCAKDKTPAPIVNAKTASDTLVHHNPQIQSFISSHCIQCHDATTGIPLDNYGHVKAFAESGQLAGCITGDPNYTKMPPYETVPAPEIQLVLTWITEGYQQ